MIYLNGYQINVTKFPDKTSQVWQLPNEYLRSALEARNAGTVSMISWTFEDEGELMHVAQLKDLLDQAGCKSSLSVHTLPYARQDKDVLNNQTFALRTFAKLLNSLNFESVYTKDIHNKELTAELIENLVHMDAEPTINMVFSRSGADMVCYPDQGARKRYELDMPFCEGFKQRCPETGYIEGYSFSGEVEGRHVLIVDDLCDGGMTFRLAAENLLKNGAKRVDLYVTHGIFSKGVDLLYRSGITKIYTSQGDVDEI